MSKGFGMHARRGGVGVFGKFGIAIGLSVAIYIVLGVIAAIVSYAMSDPTGAIGVLALCSLIASGIGGGIASARVGSDEGIGFSLLASMSVALLSMMMSLMFTGGVTLGGFMNALTYMGSGAVGGFVGRKRAVRRKRRFK